MDAHIYLSAILNLIAFPTDVQIIILYLQLLLTVPIIEKNYDSETRKFKVVEGAHQAIVVRKYFK